MPPVPPRSPGDGPQEQPFPEPRPSESTWVEPTQYETNDPAERRRLREVWHRQWEVWFAGQVRDWEQRKLRWEERERRRCAALRRYTENDRLRLDAGSRDVQALHQVRKRFAKTLALGLTAEEWHTLQCGEIPENPEARKVIRQTAEEA